LWLTGIDKGFFIHSTVGQVKKGWISIGMGVMSGEGGEKDELGLVKTGKHRGFLLKRNKQHLLSGKGFGGWRETVFY